MTRLIREEDILKHAHDVTLKNGAKHRCFDVTLLNELPKVDVIPVETVEKLCRRYIRDSRNVAKSNPTNLDKIALAIELCNRAEALGELLLMFGYDTLYREIHLVEVE